MSFSDDLKKVGRTIFNQFIKETLKKIFSPKPDKSEGKKEENSKEPNFPKSHPWRMCPIGQHWVRTHPLTIPPSDKGPKRTTTRHGHCRINSGRSEFYTADELREIAKQHFDKLIQDSYTMPVPDSLSFPNGNAYDELIGGWTKFWNETLKPKNPLTPDFVKALIATESSFRVPPDVKSKDGSARGLIQITENTRKILQDPKGELRNHLIEMTIEESREPVINIGGGIRWLHHKKYLAEHRLKREITWEEGAAEYKGILQALGKDKKSDEIMTKLRGYHKRLKDQRAQKK
ncbi:MAG: transglycosylase SLT domain-containing protein [Bdellovibrionota bacterium]